MAEKQNSGDMKLDSQLAEFLARRARCVPTVELTDLPIVDARAMYDERYAFGNTGSPACSTEDLVIPLTDSEIQGRVYRPDAVNSRECILFVHGGGWIYGGIETHDPLMRALCVLSGVPVIGIDYRRAPEHPYPEPLLNCVDAFLWIAEAAENLGIVASEITIAGDSAGANLALAACVSLRNRGSIQPAAAMLFYGCYSPLFNTASHLAFGDGRYGISTRSMDRFWQCYAGFAPPLLAAPLNADLRNLPPVYLAAAALDPLRDDTILLADRLSEAGVPNKVQVWQGCNHAFLQLADVVPVAYEAVSQAVKQWRQLCGPG